MCCSFTVTYIAKTFVKNVLKIVTPYPTMKISFFVNCSCYSKYRFIAHDNIENTTVKKGKSVSLQAWSGPEGSRKLRFPDFMTTAKECGKVGCLTHRPLLPPGNSLGTHFCYRLSRPQDHSAIGRIMSM